MGKYKNLVGEKFGRLLVKETAENKVANKIVYLCKCDCGTEVYVKASNLTRTERPTRSCGCIKKELNKTRGITHGKRNFRLYNVWASMKQRCYNKENHGYKYYGARGIKMCKEWTDSFEKFYEWAINNGYDANASKFNCTIDRINNDGDYEPSNCRWVDMKTQAKNKRKPKRQPKVARNTREMIATAERVTYNSP